jgi:hypothetical protein
MLLLYASEAERADASLARDRAALAAYALATPGSATTLRLRGGRTLVCDGPVAETREPLHGLLLIEARDLDEAIGVAKRIPGAWIGCVEVRPIAEDERTLRAIGTDPS